MGTIKTTNIEPIADNGTVTLGSSGDTFTVPSGVTVNMSNATQTGVGGVNTPSFRAYLVGSVSVADITNTVVPYDTESFDTDSAYDTSTYRFTVPSGKAGKYFFSAHAYIFQSSASLYSCDFQIRKNGANQSFDQLGLDSSDNYAYVPKSTTILDLSVGDYVDVNIIANTNDGGSFTIFGNSPYNWAVFQGFKLIT